MNDSYSHSPNAKCFYIVTRIAGPGAPSELDEQFKSGCDCESACLNTCPCSNRGYKIQNRTKCIDDKDTTIITECHDNCSCFKAEWQDPNGPTNHTGCINRLLQYGPIKNLEIFETADRGLGLRCKNFIKKNSFICEYAGEVISLHEANRRCDENLAKNRPSYVFVLREYFSCQEIITCVDPSEFGNIGRYINHSCDPNAVVLPVRIESPVPYLGVFSIKDIPANNEIHFDYGKDGLSNTPCKCDALNCRKWLPGNRRS